MASCLLKLKQFPLTALWHFNAIFIWVPLTVVLCCTAGVPENDDDWEGLAAAVYRAVLQMLPASAMSWFGSIRDRSMAVATEVSSPLPL